MKTKTNTTHTYNTTKSTKKITNWRKYNYALSKRGDFTTFLEQAKAQNAFKRPACTHTQGHPTEYTDALICLILIYREVYHQSLRQAIQLTRCILLASGIHISLPNISTLSRRARKLRINILPDDYYIYRYQPMRLLVDSSGFKVHGEGEWFRKKHGINKPRMWQESHISVDLTSRLITGVINTNNHVHDNTILRPLLLETSANLDKSKVWRTLEAIIGDGAYDCHLNYQLADDLGCTFIAPPLKTAALRVKIGYEQMTDIPGWEGRNQVIRHIEQLGDLEAWKRAVKYHDRSLVENAFFRLKHTFGDKMRSRTENGRNVEQRLRIMIMNHFTMYGLPQYVK